MTTKPKAKLPNPAPPPDAKHEPIDIKSLPSHQPLAAGETHVSLLGLDVTYAAAPKTTRCHVCGNPVVNRCEVCGHEAK